ncbi:guanine deaminase [Sneathiella limimaris]|uniref:guanine deaminase n=1 Tax=Sneathiella limimaris TaxID=1964213 RepID=UPI001469D5A0|nr:guanine deaminase [Sneathiella limimaris]
MELALRGSVLSFTDNPFLAPEEDCYVFEEDGLVVIENGKIKKVGHAPNLLPELSPETKITHYKSGLILPGFIDCHVHYPQIEVIGAYGKQLIDWLNKYTFVAEQKYKDLDYAKQAADLFLRELLQSGTTSASVFCTVAPQSVDAFFETSEKFGMLNLAGKVLMDRNAPEGLLDTAQTGYDQSKALIEKWHGRGRNLYSLTPRFAPTSTPEQMEMTGALWKEFPGTYLQSHISENKGEIEWVQELFPDCKDYLDVYDHFGQLGERAIYGHGIHLSEREFARLHETGTTLAHCPTSNLFLGSGLFSFEKAYDPARPVHAGLATDVGGGTSFSQLATMSEAYKVAQMRGSSLRAFQAFYMATRGAAEALYLTDRVGSIEPGLDADLTVIDLKATPLLEYRLSHAETLHDILFVLMILAEAQSIKATYVGGKCLMERVNGSVRFADPL